MIDLDRFTDIEEGQVVTWNIWAKVGSTDPDSDRGWNDGDLTYAQPLQQGTDAYGSPYGGEIKGQDLKGYAILQVDADKDTIRKLFKVPSEDSEAHKRKRKNYSFIDLEDIFTVGEVAHYRDHSREIPVLKNFNLKKISDYRKIPERLNAKLPHGSITSGTYYVDGGPAPGYTTLKTAVDDIGAVASNTLEIIVTIANSPGANIDFDKETNADGLIWIHSTAYNYRSNPLIIGGGKWWQLDGRCNLLIEHIMVNGMSLHYDSPTSGSTGRTHTYRLMFFDRTTNHDPIFPNIDNPGTPITIEFYGNVILAPDTASGARCNDFIIGSGWDGPTWTDNIFIENNTFICDKSFSEAGLTVSGTNINCSFANNAIYQSDGATAWDNNLSSSTITLNNCARNKALVGTITENDCVANLVAGDFLSVVLAKVDCGKIIGTSQLYEAGKATGNIPGYTFDIIGQPVSATSPSIGAFSGRVVNPFDADAMILGPATSDPTLTLSGYMQLNPTYDYNENRTSERSEHRSISGQLFTYIYREYTTFEIPETFQNSVHVATIKSWYNSETDLIFIPRADAINTNHNVRIVGDEEPFTQYAEPFFQNKYNGSFTLETIS